MSNSIPPGRRASARSRGDGSGFELSTAHGGNTGHGGSSRTGFTNENGPLFSASTPKREWAAKTQGTTGRATRIELQVNWHALSPRGQAILRLVGVPTSLGYSVGEIASELGTTTSWVSSRLDELRNEIERGSSR